MSRINSLVGPAPTTFLSSSGPTNTWLDDYIDNPDYRPGGLGNGSFHNNHDFFQEIPEYTTLPLLKGESGYNGEKFTTPIPNHTEYNDPGFTRMANATDREWWNIIKTLTGKLG